MSKKPKAEYKKKDEDLIADLVNDQRWEAMKKVIDLRIEYLKNLLNPFSNQFIIEKDTPEMIGFKFLIVSAVIDFLTEIRDLPEMIEKSGKEEYNEGGE